MSLGYLDGNTGSLLATVMVGGTAGAVVAARSARARLSGAFGRKKGAGTPPDAADSPDAPVTPESVDAEAPTDAVDAPTDAAAPTASGPGDQAASPAGPPEAAPGA